MIKKITSRSNPQLIAFLNEKEKYFIFEGEKLVRDILQKGIPVSILMVKIDRETELKPPHDNIENLWLVNDRVIDKISSLKNRSSYIAAVKIKPAEINLAGENIVIALDNIQDPTNAGTIFRCAAAFGISTILFSENCVKPNNPKFIRAAQTSLFEVKFHHYSNINELIDHGRKLKFQVFLTSSRKTAANTDIKSIKPPVIIIFGNEGQGLAPQLFTRLPSVRIPHRDCIESLNVGVSACILMYELTKNPNFNSKNIRRTHDRKSNSC